MVKMSSGDTSRPAMNKMKTVARICIVPSWGLRAGPVDDVGLSPRKGPRRVGPRSIPTRSWPTMAGCLKWVATSPARTALPKSKKRSTMN